MLLLTFDAGISSTFASGAFLQFDGINYYGAAGCTTHQPSLVAHLKKNITAPINLHQARTTRITNYMMMISS
jgi:hypothetical protein